MKILNVAKPSKWLTSVDHMTTSKSNVQIYTSPEITSDWQLTLTCWSDCQQYDEVACQQSLLCCWLTFEWIFLAPDPLLASTTATPTNNALPKEHIQGNSYLYHIHGMLRIIIIFKETVSIAFNQTLTQHDSNAKWKLNRGLLEMLFIVLYPICWQNELHYCLENQRFNILEIWIFRNENEIIDSPRAVVLDRFLLFSVFPNRNVLCIFVSGLCRIRGLRWCLFHSEDTHKLH